MVSIGKKTAVIWWIVRKSDNSSIHYGQLDIGTVLDSGLDIAEEFATEEEWITRLNELGIIIEE